MEEPTYLQTNRLGGVDVQADQLKAMQAGDYILHARGGKLEKVAVDKTRLPLDPQGHVQRLNMVQAPDGTIYAAQHTLIHKSTDSGRTWEHLERDPTPFGGWRLQFDDDGAMLNVAHPSSEGSPTVWASRDEGLTWRQIGEITLPDASSTGLGFSVTRLANGALLVPVQISDAQTDASHMLLSGVSTCYVYRSEDGGRSWAKLSVLGDWCCEVNVAAVPGGRLLAAIRYQRPKLPDDTPELNERTGAPGGSFPYKHVFVAHSDDQGRTWTPPRQLTTVYGQCFASAVGLPDGTAVVIHDHRYPRNMSGARAMVSRDAGETWADEVYYLNNGDASGYAASLLLDGGEILTFAGSCSGGVESGWDYCTGRTDFLLVRWRLV